VCDAAAYSQIWKTRSCAGISGKAQILFLVVFVTRYLDLVTNFISVYNTTMKVFFVGSSAATVYLMYVKFKATYDGNHDTFRCVVSFSGTGTHLTFPERSHPDTNPIVRCDVDLGFDTEISFFQVQISSYIMVQYTHIPVHIT
jgi:hypothetical protein